MDKRRRGCLNKNLLKLILLIVILLFLSYIGFSWCQVRQGDEDLNESVYAAALSVNNGTGTGDNFTGAACL